MKKYKINKSVSLKIVELWTKTHMISNKRNRMVLTLVSPWGGSSCLKVGLPEIFFGAESVLEISVLN